MPYKLEVPLDASRIENFDPKLKLKVLARDAKRTVGSAIVKLDARGQAVAALTFEDRPGPLRVMVGPADASDNEMVGLQTLTTDVSARQWGRRRTLKLRPLLIKPYYWKWWLRWCRTFTISGRVLCADGSPVPGAEVCAYDTDWWFVWSSSQRLGCDTTDENGAFEMKFRWCCGWWPWWWLRYRLWRIDPDLVARVGPVLERNPDLKISARSELPTLKIFGDLVANEGVELRKALKTDVQLIERLRRPLLERLPGSLELERLRIWPWWPWQPWWDCNPDVIFKVTQNCEGEERVIVDERCFEARPNIPTSYEVDLTANDEACCIPTCPEPCPEGECVVVDRLCTSELPTIGPNGFYREGVVDAYDRDRAFAGTVKVFKLGTMVGVDYYEIVDTALAPLPTGAELNFNRGYWDTASLDFGSVPFPALTLDDTLGNPHKVYLSRERYETDTGLAWDQPGADRWWTSGHKDLIVPMNSRAFSDDSHRFQVVGWNIDAAGHLINPRPLPTCGSADPNEFVVAINNRVTNELGHPASHNCGEGVHSCTSEPDTHIISVKINGVEVEPCGVVDAQEGVLEVKYLVHDPGGQLARYTLKTHYGLSQAENLLAHATSVTASPVLPDPAAYSGWSPAAPSATYGTAIAQGASDPNWYGGEMTVTVPLQLAFPIPCCYLIRLWAVRRTIESCDYSWPQRNRSEYTLGVGICEEE